MAGFRIKSAVKVAKTVTTKAVVVSHGKHPEWNGEGGFKPGNQYGKGVGSHAEPSSTPLVGGRSERQGSLFGSSSRTTEKKPEPERIVEKVKAKVDDGSDLRKIPGDAGRMAARKARADVLRAHVRQAGSPPTLGGMHSVMADRPREVSRVRQSALALKYHRNEGPFGNHIIGDEHAATLTKIFQNPDRQAAIQTTDPLAHAHAEIGAAHSVQRRMNARDARITPIHEIKGPEHPTVQWNRKDLAEVENRVTQTKRSEEIYTKEHEKAIQKETRADKKAEKIKTEKGYHSEEYLKAARARGKAGDELNSISVRLREIRYNLDPANHGSDAAYALKLKNRLADSLRLHGDGTTKIDHAAHIVHNPDQIAPGPIGERIKRNKVADAKIHHIDQLEVRNTTANEQHFKEVDRLNRETKLIDARYSEIESIPNWSKNKKLEKEYRDLTRKAIENNNKLFAFKVAIREQNTALSNKATEILTVDQPLKFDSRPAPAGFTNYQGKGLEAPTGLTKANQDVGETWLGKVTRKADNDAIDVEIGAGDGVRAHYHPGFDYIQLDRWSPSKTVVHEWGHTLESKLKTGDQPLMDRSIEFLKHRVGDETPVDMHQKFGAGNPGEMGRKDKFDNVFPESSAYYTGKVYGTVEQPMSTEILSMGAQELHENPVRFVRADHEYSSLVIGLLDGSLR